MSHFDYSHLIEEDDVNSDARCDDGHQEERRSLDQQNDEKKMIFSRLQSNQVDDDGDGSYSGCEIKYPTKESHQQSKTGIFSSTPAKPNNCSPSQNSIKYTRLKPKRVAEEGFDHDVDASTEDNFGSHIHLSFMDNGVKRRTKWKCRRFHVLICVLLGTAALLVMFSLLYIFVIFPSPHGSVLLPDGETYTDDIEKMKKLGKNVVVTSCGLVRGTRERGAYVFKGIPYAVPPTGKRRWKTPEPLSFESETCWYHVFNATHFGNKCVQPNFRNSSILEGNEDCLVLNIWTPSLKPKENYPVMVWLHSGDLVHGSGHMTGMSPSPEVALETKAVYVSINYRLGIFGFLAVNVLREGREPRGSAGNYGIMDQQLALRWIQENIRHFGGNQFDVTIFGHGSGGTSIQALLSSHFSHGLFHRAWLSSPVAIVNKTLEISCKDNQKIMTQTGCKSAHCLRSLSTEKVLKASPWPLDPFWTIDRLFYTPLQSQIRNDLVIFDGHVVKFSPEDVGPVGVDVPTLLGTTYFEISSLRSKKALVSLTEDEFNDLLVHHTHLYGTDTIIQMKRLYSLLPKLHYTSPVHFPPHPGASLAHLIGDLRNICPLRLLATAMDFVYSSPVYMYTVEIYPSHNLLLSNSETKSFLGWDIVAFFNAFDKIEFTAGQGDLNFRNLMRQEIINFVKKGKPISSRWKTVDHNTGIMEQGVTVTPSTSDYFEHCDFWDGHEFFKYTWRKSS